jgi:hypothetical protein
MVPIAATYNVGAATPINGGRWPGGRLSGAIALGNATPAGSMSSNTSALAAALTLDDIATGGALSDTVPSWLRSAAVHEWVAVPNSTLQGSPAWQAMPTPGFWGNQLGFVNAENGTGLNEETSEVWLFGGGHSDYAGNELASIVLAADSPVWQLRCTRSEAAAMKPYGSGGTDPAWNTDGKPNSRHSYSGTHFIRKLNRYFAIDGYTWDSANIRPMGPATFDVDAGAWEASGTWPAPPGSDSSSSPGIYAKHPVTEDIYYGAGGGYKLFKLDTTTKTWTTVTSAIGSYFPGTDVQAIDSARNGLTVLSTRAGAGLTNTVFFRVDLTTGVRTDLTMQASADWTAFQAMSTNHGGLHYAADLDCFFYCFGGTGQGGKVWKITHVSGDTWAIQQLTMTGATVPAGTGVANGNILSRFRYLPALRAVMAFPAANSPIYVAKVA